MSTGEVRKVSREDIQLVSSLVELLRITTVMLILWLRIREEVMSKKILVHLFFYEDMENESMIEQLI